MAYEAALAELRLKGLHRTLRPIESAQGPVVRSRGSDYLNFSSNDYLGLASDARLVVAAQEALLRWGTGSGASRLVTGSIEIHHRLEESIARFKGEEAALVFSSGFAANLGAMQALAGRGDTVWIDRYSHASIVDAARLSGASLKVYPHLDLEFLDRQLARRAGKKHFILTDSYFSMDGDTADLKELDRISSARGATLVVDEAHAAGVFGKHGGGLVEEAGLEGRIGVTVATFSKAFGSHGGFLAGSQSLIDFLINKARTFIYSTAPSPASSAASLEAIRIVATDGSLRERLWENVSYLRRRIEALGLKTGASRGPIVPIIIGKTEDALALSERLLENGILVPAIRPPTVPKGTDRLRATVTAAHTREHIDRFSAALKKCA